MKRFALLVALVGAIILTVFAPGALSSASTNGVEVSCSIGGNTTVQGISGNPETLQLVWYQGGTGRVKIHLAAGGNVKDPSYATPSEYYDLGLDGYVPFTPDSVEVTLLYKVGNNLSVITYQEIWPCS